MNENRISRAGQIRVYLGKCFRLFVSEKQWKNFISTLVIIVLVCMVTGDSMFVNYKDTKNGIFAIVSACIWIGLFNSIRSICRERAIIKREHRTGLHISSYVLAHVLYEWVLCAVETLIVLLVVLITNSGHLPDSGVLISMFVDMYLVLLSVTFGADMMSLVISCIVKDENAAMTVMPFILIIQLVMSGVIFEMSRAKELLSYLTISKWGMEGLSAVANTTRSVYTQALLLGSVEYSSPEGASVLFACLLLNYFVLIYIAVGIIALKQVDRDER